MAAAPTTFQQNFWMALGGVSRDQRDERVRDLLDEAERLMAFDGASLLRECSLSFQRGHVHFDHAMQTAVLLVTVDAGRAIERVVFVPVADPWLGYQINVWYHGGGGASRPVNGAELLTAWQKYGASL